MSEYDLLIRNGKVVDGSGNLWFYGDVLVQGDRIAAVTPVGQEPSSAAKTVVDATDHVIAPGFIDIQSHSILPLMVDGRSVSKLLQGVTTEIMGEGWTPAPVIGRNTDPLDDVYFSLDIGDAWRSRIYAWYRFRDWLDAMVEHGVSPNVGSFLGGGTLRTIGKGLEMGRPNDAELALMQQTMAAAMQEGAFGVSYALIYPPDVYTDTDELAAICEVVAAHRGVYITHIRDEGDRLEEAMDEAIELGRRTGVAVEVYHLKASGAHNWHKMPGVIEQISQARRTGVDITADMYPYAASGTGLSAVLPPWAMAEGKLYENLRDPEMRARIKEEMLHPSGDWEPMGTRDPSAVMPIGFELAENKQYTALRLTQIAEQRGQDWVDTVFDLLASEEQRISTIYFSMDEENLRLQLRQPWIKISTDAGGFDPAWAEPLGPYHPRAYGTYPRVLGRYVREEGIITLEDAVRKMTWSVAARLNMRSRGLLAPGKFADIVVFDPATITDHATFDEPHQLATGVRDVWVNGVRVVADGKHNDATPGRVVTPD
ncbi:MAG: D-aminoacylase [Caldilineaceae bacterium]|nr:D-aminoacylase [Caldilineaceae bacterium]